MKKLSIINVIFCLILLSCGCKNWVERHYELEIKNSSSINVYTYFYLVWEGGPDGAIYPDTLLSFDKRELICINSGEKFRTSRPVVPIIEWISSLPKDTLSVYYFHPDTLQKYSWEEIQREYKVLRRYDLSVEDIILLQNKYGVPEIPYPPNERMKNMKMYPPYKN
jgi:hypothetical protein